MTNAVSQAIATRREAIASDPRKLVASYTEELSNLLPTHVKSEMFVRAAAGALRTGKMTNGEFDLEVAARNNPQAFINTLRTAARLGLAPGSEEFYLTVRKVKGRPEILGIVGYQGYIELMFRAGAVSSVVVDTVHEGEQFDFMRGRDEYPLHAIDWRAERGKLELVYAYAKMKDGGTSYVVVLNQFDIDRIKKKSPSAAYDASPWQTDERAMWLKSAIRRLKTWVPTSTERVGALLRAEHEATQPAIIIPDAARGQEPVPLGHQVFVPDPDEVIEGELVPEEQSPVEQVPPPEEEPTPPAGDVIMGRPMHRAMMATFSRKGLGGKDQSQKRHDVILSVIGHEVQSSAALTVDEGRAVIKYLETLPDAPAAAEQVTTDVPLPAGE